MRISKTRLKDVLVVTPDVFKDHRGSYLESYNINTYTDAGIPQLFIQDDFSASSRGVLRGIHGDHKTWKLISCVYGVIQLVVVDEDNNWQDFILCGPEQSDTYRDKVYTEVLIPPSYGNGHLVLSDYGIFHYKQTTSYDPNSQFTIPWNHPTLNIQWGMSKRHIITSERDAGI